MNNKYNFIDLTGKRFGRLTVLNKSIQRGNKGQIKWDCICDCGNYHTVSGESLRDGKSKSCGCLRKEHMPPNKIKDRFEFLRMRLYKSIIIKRSKQINKSFDLSYESFCKIIEQPCFYCGELNSNCIQDYSTKQNKFISDTVIYYNGIDRVDNNLGYLNTNVVACCKRCNSAKNDMLIDEFINWINKVHKNINSEKEPYCDIAMNRIKNVI